MEWRSLRDESIIKAGLNGKEQNLERVVKGKSWKKMETSSQEVEPVGAAPGGRAPSER